MGYLPIENPQVKSSRTEQNDSPICQIVSGSDKYGGIGDYSQQGLQTKSSHNLDLSFPTDKYIIEIPDNAEILKVFRQNHPHLAHVLLETKLFQNYTPPRV